MCNGANQTRKKKTLMGRRNGHAQAIRYKCGIKLRIGWVESSPATMGYLSGAELSAALFDYFWWTNWKPRLVTKNHHSKKSKQTKKQTNKKKQQKNHHCHSH
jgi:hypothetical protein